VCVGFDSPGFGSLDEMSRPELIERINASGADYLLAASAGTVSPPSVPVSAREPDWTREAKRRFEWAPSRSLLAAIRAYQRQQGRRGPLAALRRRLAVLRHRFWSVVTGADIPVNCQLGGGLLMPHPNGIVIHPGVVVGPNCLVLQQVTLGVRDGGLPVLGGHVDVGAGAKLLGAIRVGDHACIGANAVVLHDVPDGATAVGVPARLVVPRRGPHEQGGNTERPDGV
jgi:serine O-acetyltransferase